MLFNSYIFILCFLPICVLGYFTINRFAVKKRESLGQLWLSLASFVFFAYAGPKFLPVLAGSILVNFLFAHLLKKQRPTRRRKLVLATGIGLQLLPLFYYKYTGFFLQVLGQFLEINTEFFTAAPLGISFFTFSQISWLVDCYGRKSEENQSLLSYTTYVTFFPKLTMGPIMLQKEFLVQWRGKEKKFPDYSNMAKGIYLFSLGLAKKVLLADTLAKIVAIGYAHVSSLNSITAVVVMISYTLQLYFDFSGYCDMAGGIGYFFHICLPINFNSPYRAKSIHDFWARWHMTLTRFFTAYLYIPLGGNRKGKLRTYVNTLLVFLISGLWHGANWTFLFWGALHGTLMIMEKIIKDLGIGWKQLPLVLKKIRDIILWAVTFLIINISWVFFRAESMEQAKLFLSRITSGGWQLSEEVKEYMLELIEIRILMRLGLEDVFHTYAGGFVVISLGILVLSCLFMKNTREKTENFDFSLGKAVITTGLLLWCIVSLSSISEFLYFEF